jgi:hypothetical protein
MRGIEGDGHNARTLRAVRSLPGIASFADHFRETGRGVPQVLCISAMSL